MQLTANQVEKFYKIWMPLLHFVNDRRKIDPEITPANSWTWAEDAVKVRDVLWSDDSLLDSFIHENPARLSSEELEIAAGWRSRKQSRFLVFRHLKKHSILLNESEDFSIYAVVGLATPLNEMVPFTPCSVKAVLLPFEGKITIDSFLTYFPIHYGPNIRKRFSQDYRQAKERGAVVDSLALHF